MSTAFLFLFGLAIGSFMNVLALRYDGEHFLFDPKVIGGRSHCPRCGRTLSWSELIPIVSFLIQRGKCRACSVRIGLQYLLVELISGLIFLFVPMVLFSTILSVIWILVFECLVLVAYIDLRLQIIPDELSVALGILAIFEAIFAAPYLGGTAQSFLFPYLSFLGFASHPWTARLIGTVVGGGFFAALVLLTRGKGMGIGDVKLGIPLGFLFGWPDIAALYGVAFVIGGVWGAVLLALRKKSMRSAIPFGPFIVAGAFFIFFLGLPAADWYFRIIGV